MTAHLEFGLFVSLDCFPHDADLLGDVADLDFDAVLGVLLEVFAHLRSVFSREQEKRGKWTFRLWPSNWITLNKHVRKENAKNKGQFLKALFDYS